MSVRKMTRIALLSAILYVSKVALEAFANVELISTLIIVYTLVFGRETFLIITVFNLFELIQWGFGSWWVSYLYVWPLLCLSVLLLKKLVKEEFLVWSVVAGCFGLIFGGLFAIAYLPIDPSHALAYWISGLPWDVGHGVCNFVLTIVLGKPLYKVLRMLKNRFFAEE
ncbi:MAG: hypothetical protein HDQ97_10595 [Lachnospiraceae bacterium]|nr:hypothetical protein [Lachnospiraceae bacterium]